MGGFAVYDRHKAYHPSDELIDSSAVVDVVTRAGIGPSGGDMHHHCEPGKPTNPTEAIISSHGPLPLSLSLAGPTHPSGHLSRGGHRAFSGSFATLQERQERQEKTSAMYRSQGPHYLPFS